MKKILFFLESLSGGGAEKVLVDLVSNLDKSKYNITVVSLVDVGVYNEQIKQICNYRAILPKIEDNDPVLQKIIYKLKYKLIRALPKNIVYNWCFKEAYDTEIAFIEGFCTKLISASNNSNSKKIAWVHIDLEANHWTQIEYKNLKEEIDAYQKFDYIIHVAESVKMAFSRKFGITENLLVKHNPVNKEAILKKAIAPLDITYSNSDYCFVTVGRLEHQKGYDRLLEIAERLKNEQFKFKIWIVGEGSMRNDLELYIMEKKLQDYVVLHGFQTNPYKFIKHADAFVCSSRSEGYSTVVTEALILGKPIIATDCSGMTELLGNNEYGIITKNNTEALFLGIKQFLLDKNIQEHYRQKSRERGNDFDLNKTIKSIEELL